MSRNRTLGAPYEQVGVTASFTTEPHVDRYLVSTPVAGPAVTVTLDPNAQDGDQVCILDAAGNAGTHAILVEGSPGQVVKGAANIDVNGGSVELTFSFGLGGVWTVQGAGNSVPVPASPVTANNATTLSSVAGTVTFSHTYESETGNVLIVGVMAVVGTAGDSVSFQLSVDGGPILFGPIVSTTLTTPGGTANATLVWRVTGLSIGSHTFSIECTDPLNTMTVTGRGATLDLSQY